MDGSTPFLADPLPSDRYSLSSILEHLIWRNPELADAWSWDRFRHDIDGMSQILRAGLPLASVAAWLGLEDCAQPCGWNHETLQEFISNLICQPDNLTARCFMRNLETFWWQHAELKKEKLPLLTPRRTSPAPRVAYVPRHPSKPPKKFTRVGMYDWWDTVSQWLDHLLKDIEQCIAKPYEMLNVLDSGPEIWRSGCYYMFNSQRDIIPIKPIRNPSLAHDTDNRKRETLLNKCCLAKEFVGPEYLSQIDGVPTAEEMTDILEFREYHHKEMVKQYCHLFYHCVLIKENLIPFVNKAQSILTIGITVKEDENLFVEEKAIDCPLPEQEDDYVDDKDLLNYDDENDPLGPEEIDSVHDGGLNHDDENNRLGSKEDPFDNDDENKISIKVIGIGGGGSKAVNKTAGIMTGHVYTGVKFWAIDSDTRTENLSLLHQSKILLLADPGPNRTSECATVAANNIKHSIQEALEGANIVFVTAAMGGATGAGASPVVAEIAKSMGILTVGVVSMPFAVERKMKIADDGLECLAKTVDTLIIIHSDDLDGIHSLSTFKEVGDALWHRIRAVCDSLSTFKEVDDALGHCIRAVCDILMPCARVPVQIDDVNAILQDAGSCSMGRGTAEGNSRSKKAAKEAVESPTLHIQIKRAKAIIMNITGGPDFTMPEVDSAVETIAKLASKDVKMIHGVVIDPSFSEQVSVTLILTGFKEHDESQDTHGGDKMEG